jgi:hypothetical protein
VGFRELGLVNAFTMEASFCGAAAGKHAKQHFNAGACTAAPWHARQALLLLPGLARVRAACGAADRWPDRAVHAGRRWLH